MRILVMSDTHGNYPLAFQASDMVQEIDCLVHLGDGAEDANCLADALDIDIIHVAGNCDIGSTSPRELVLKCEGKRLLLVHGDAYGVKNGLGRLEARAVEVEADAVLFGHTHHALVTFFAGNILAINPGSLMRNGPHASFAILEVTAAGISARLHTFE